MADDKPKKPRRNSKESIFQQWRDYHKMPQAASDSSSDVAPAAESGSVLSCRHEIPAQLMLDVPVDLLQVENGRHCSGPLCKCNPFILIYDDGAIVFHNSAAEK